MIPAMAEGSSHSKPAPSSAGFPGKLVWLGLTAAGTAWAASSVLSDLTNSGVIRYWKVGLVLVLASATAGTGWALLRGLLSLARRPSANAQPTTLLASASMAPDSDAQPDFEVAPSPRLDGRPAFIDRSELESIPSRPDRVVIWAAELARGMLPPVCVRSGRPAETALRYRFVSRSDGRLKENVEAYGDLLEVITGGALAVPPGAIDAIMANRVSGLMPLTRAQRRLVLVIRRAEALGLSGGVMVLAGIILAFTGLLPVVGVLLIAVGSLLFLAEVLWMFTGRPFFGPKGRVLEAPRGGDHIVELRRVHPDFAAAVRRMRAAAVAVPVPG